MSKENQGSLYRLIGQLQKSKDWHRVLNEISQMNSAVIDVIGEAQAMYEKETTITENTSDGYHTFKELYEFKKAYNVALFNEWGSQKERQIGNQWTPLNTKNHVHKSWKHHDGELCFGGGWFIVVAVLQTGQITNHYKAEDWDLFNIPEVEKALFPFDGHTSEDVIKRLLES
jgi:hypothetical protein